MRFLKITIAVFSLLFAAVSVPATAMAPNEEIIIKIKPKKTKINPSELPDAVKEAIMEGDYANWNIDRAYIITYSDDADKVEYEVHFTSEQSKEGKQIEVYDKDGKIIED